MDKKKKALLFSFNFKGIVIWNKFLQEHCKANFPEFANLTVENGKTPEELLVEPKEDPKVKITDYIEIDPTRHVWGDKGKQKKWCLPTILLDLEKETNQLFHPKQLIKPRLADYVTDKYDPLAENIDEQLKEILRSQKEDKGIVPYIYYLGTTDSGEFTEEVEQLFLGEELPQVSVDRPNPVFSAKAPRPKDRQLLTESTPIKAFLQIYKNTKTLVDTSSLKTKPKETSIEINNQLEL